jgi:hypothetical protein
MRHFTLARSLFLLLALGAAGCDDDDTTNPASFAATLNAADAAPPTTSTATGAATLVFDGDSTVQYTIDVTNLADATAAHIHSGAPGSNGDVRVTLFTDQATGGGTTGTTSPPMTGQLATGTFTASDVQGLTFEALVEEMRAGNAYVDVHTMASPDGEIRGQIRLRE